MFRCLQITVCLLAGVLSFTAATWAQSDEIPLGDVARELKKSQAPPRRVIDNDNLSDVMEQGENKRWADGNTRISLEHASMELVSSTSPDVTCALSFSGQRDLLAGNLHPENLPDTEIGKLDGPATIVGDALQVSLHNGSSWDLREITVGITLVHRREPALNETGVFRLLPAALTDTSAPEKPADITVLFHMKGTSAPSATTLFQAPLSITVGPDQEWHWAIVQARGIPPASKPEPASGPESMIQSPN